MSCIVPSAISGDTVCRALGRVVARSRSLGGEDLRLGLVGERCRGRRDDGFSASEELGIEGSEPGGMSARVEGAMRLDWACWWDGKGVVRVGGLASSSEDRLGRARAQERRVDRLARRAASWSAR